MSDPQQTPITNETIEMFVRMTRAAEVLAKTLDCSVSRAVEIQLRTLQAMMIAQADTSASALVNMASASTKVQ